MEHVAVPPREAVDDPAPGHAGRARIALPWPEADAVLQAARMVYETHLELRARAELESQGALDDPSLPDPQELGSEVSLEALYRTAREERLPEPYLEAALAALLPTRAAHERFLSRHDAVLDERAAIHLVYREYRRALTHALAPFSHVYRATEFVCGIEELPAKVHGPRVRRQALAEGARWRKAEALRRFFGMRSRKEPSVAELEDLVALREGIPAEDAAVGRRALTITLETYACGGGSLRADPTMRIYDPVVVPFTESASGIVRARLERAYGHALRLGEPRFVIHYDPAALP